MKKFLLTFLLSGAGLLPLSAQDVKWSDARQFNIAILGLLDEYERTSTLAEKKDRDTFLQLFCDQDAACLYNDIMGTDHFQESISPTQYVSSIPDNGNTVLQSEIGNIRKEGDFYWENGLLHRKVSFSKYIMVIDGSVYSEGEGGVLFDSSTAFPGEPDFRLIADFVYDPQEGNCRIMEITPLAKKRSSPLDEEKFSVIVKSSTKYDSQLTSNGEPLQFNSFDQSFAYFNDIDIRNQDIYVEPVEYANCAKYNVLGIKFHPMHFRGKVYGEMTLGSSFDVQSSTSVISAASSSKDFGIDLGFETTVVGNWRAGLYAGIGLSLSELNLSLAQISYLFTYVNPARNYTISGSEKASLIDLMIPLYLENEFSLGQRLVLDIDLGAKFYLNHETKLGPLNVSGSFGGKNENHSYTAFRSPADYTRESYDISLFGRAELDYRIWGRKLYAYVSYGFEQGLQPVYDSGLNAFYSPARNIYPVYYSITSGTDIPYRSMISSVNYKRKAGWLSAGFKIKF